MPCGHGSSVATPSAVGRVVSLNDRAYTVTGILPRQFRVPGDDEVDLIVPFQETGFAWTDQRLMILQVIGRVRPGVTPRQAATELQAITERDRPNIPPFFQHALLRNALVLVPLREWLVGDRRPALAALLGAVGLLLLIACVNVANLQLARAAERQREIGLRAALGASRVRLARWLIIENLALSAMAGMLGVAIAYAITALLQHAPGFPQAGAGRPANRLDTLGRNLRALSPRGPGCGTCARAGRTARRVERGTEARRALHCRWTPLAAIFALHWC